MEKIEIPKYVFDKEYSTHWRREVQFLEDKGIMYTYAKRHPKYPVIFYKYTKTPELFLALADFFNQVRMRQVMDKIDDLSKAVTEPLPIEKGYIEVKAEDLSEGEKELVTEQDIENTIKDDVNKVDDTE